MIGKFVIVRCLDAGVHVGTLVEQSKECVLLANSSRVWRWRGANTLDEMAIHGVDEEYSRISKQSELKLLLTGREIILCSDNAAKNLSRPRWGA